MSTTKKTGTTTEGKPYSPLWRLISVIVLAPLVGVLIRNKYEGQGNIPAKGGVILPVYRGAADAALVLKEAEKRIGQGAAVIVYPEGTATRDPDLWPMVAKTGVARLALSSGAPVIPIAHWGTDEILHYGDKKPQFFPRKTVRTIAGPPVDLTEWAGQAHSARALRAATEKIMTEVAALLGQLRGETPPAIPYDPKNPPSRTDNVVSPAPADSPSPEKNP
jgi:hypothetical protein